MMTMSGLWDQQEAVFDAYEFCDWKSVPASGMNESGGSVA